MGEHSSANLCKMAEGCVLLSVTRRSSVPMHYASRSIDFTAPAHFWD